MLNYILLYCLIIRSKRNGDVLPENYELPIQLKLCVIGVRSK